MEENFEQNWFKSNNTTPFNINSNNTRTSFLPQFLNDSNSETNNTGFILIILKCIYFENNFR